MNQKPVRLDYTTNSTTKSLYYERSGFAGTPSDVAQSLRGVIAADAVKVIQLNHLSDVSDERTDAPKSVCQALCGYAFNSTFRGRILDFIKRLPPLSVRLFPLHHYAFKDNKSYLGMYHQFEQKGFIRMDLYISEAGSASEEQVRFRVMMATYILGLISPLTASEKRNFKTLRLQRHRQKETPILSRIMENLREETPLLRRIFNRIMDIVEPRF